MPEVDLNSWQKLRPHQPHWIHAASVASALWMAAFSLAALCADGAGTDVVTTTAAAEHAPIRHLTDEQDRVSNGHLSRAAEARSEANALYAQVMLLPDGVASNRSQALEIFRKITALDPSFLEARIKLANILLQLGQMKPALAQLEAAAADNPQSIPVEVALGYTQHLCGLNDDARRVCTRALKVDSTQSAAMRVLLEIASDQNDLAGAVLHIEDILKADPAVPASAWLNLARLYQEVARGESLPPSERVVLRTRLPLLQRAADIAPPNVDTLSLLADTYRSLGLKKDALKTLRRVVALEPSKVELLLRCAELESDQGNRASALADYEHAYALNPSLPGLREMLGALYLDHHRFADAVRVFEEALVDSPHDWSAEIDLGLAYEEVHQHDKAQACFRRVFASTDCPQDAYLKLAGFQIGRQEMKEADQTLASAQTHFPQSARVTFYRAILYRCEKNYPAALACLEQVRRLAIGTEASALDPDYYIESALSLSLAGEKEHLEAVLREGLEKFPDNPDMMNELAYFWADRGDHLAEALALSQHAAELDPDSGPILDTRGWVYFRMGQTKDALPYLQRAAFMTNNDPVVLQHVGDAFYKLGLRREAIATWTRALQKDPRNGDLAHRIDAAQAQAKNANSRSAPTP